MTGDRVAEIRDRVEAGGLNKRDASDLAFLLNMLGLRTAERDYRKNENAELFTENARLRAQLDTVRELDGDSREHLFEGVFELAGKYDIDITNSPDMRPGVPEAGDLCGDVLNLFRETIRAALNQGGEHV